MGYTSSVFFASTRVRKETDPRSGSLFLPHESGNREAFTQTAHKHTHERMYCVKR